MAGKFNAKFFNGEVFQKYIDRIPNPRKTELLKSRAIRSRPELASSMRDEVGGNYISTPLKGLISGSVPMNYDGNTDITPSSTETFMQSRVVVGRANAWAELDFSYDITGGEDFMENVAEQINDYWNEIDQDTLVAILKGVFSMTDTQGKKFVTTHTHDVTALLNADGKTGVMDATTMNTAIQRASGDQKGKFTLVLMHSVVATNLENLKLLTYLKYNDADGMQRDIGLATLNGRLVLVDDSIVRGTTSARIIKLLRDAGAKEVHFRVSAPPFKYPCYFGTDIPDQKLLVATGRTVDQINEIIGADTLGYLSTEHVVQLAQNANCGFCTACFTGEYAVKPDEVLSTDIHERHLNDRPKDEKKLGE